MRERWVIWALMFSLGSLVWGQAAILAFDSDTLISAGLSPVRGGFGITVVDSYDVIDSTHINIHGRILTYGGSQFGGGGTTLPAFYLDGQVYSANPYAPPPADTVSPDNTEYSEFENVLIADWWLADSNVQFTQTLYPFSVDSQGAVLIRYTVINHDTVSHEVGVLLFLDTNIDGVDDAPFVYPGIEIESTTVLTGEEIPPYFQVYEIGPMVPDSEQTVARLIMDGLPNIKPNEIAICDQRTALSLVVWDLSVLPPEPISDGMIVLKWGPEVVEPGEGITYACTYGLAPEGEFIGGPLGGRIEMPRNATIFHCNLIPNPFSISVLLRNNTDSSMYNIRAQFVINHPGVTVDPDSVLFLADTLLPSEIIPTAWTAVIDSPPVTDTTIACTLYAWAETTATDGTTDTIVTIIPREVYVPGATYQGPTAEIVYPLDNTVTSNMYQPICIYLTDDDTTVAPLSIRLGFIDPTSGDTLPWVIRPGIAGCTYENDTLYFPNEIHRADGERVMYFLKPTYDMRGCPLDPPVGASYLVDLSPPELGYAYYYPYDDTIVEDSLIVAWINVEDRINRIDTLSVSVTIADDESTHTHFFTDTTRGYYDSLLWYDFDTSFLYIDPLREGWRFPDGIVTITLDSVCDDPDYGEPNCATFTPLSWSFIVNAHGPRAYPRVPDDGWFVSIPNPDITFYLYDGNGVDPSSVSYVVDGDTFSAPPSYGWHDSLITHAATTSWDDGYTVEVEVLSAVDTFGKSLDTTSHYRWSFTIDMTPPEAALVSPAEGDTITSPMPTVEISLTDALAGIDPSSVILNVAGTEYTVDGTVLSYDETAGMLTWDGVAADADLSDSVVLCLHAADRVSLGDPNAIDTCFWFWVSPNAPSVEFLSDGYSICSDDADVEIGIYDPDGVDGASIVLTLNSDTLTLDAPNVSYDGATGVLTISPDGGSWGTEGDTVRLCVVSAADIYGSAISSPVCRTFVVDLTPPQVTGIEIIGYTHDSPGILDSTDIVFHFQDEYGIVDTVNTVLEVYLSGALVGEFNPVDDPEILYFADDSTLIFSPGAEFVFSQDSTYEVCLTLDDACYAGMHEEATTCTTYYASDIAESPAKPERDVLLPNYPDPFNSRTVIPVYMAKQGLAFVEVVDVEGRHIKTLWHDVLPAGVTPLAWNGTSDAGKDMPSGVYFVKLVTPTTIQISRISLIR